MRSADVHIYTYTHIYIYMCIYIYVEFPKSGALLWIQNYKALIILLKGHHQKDPVLQTQPNGECTYVLRSEKMGGPVQVPAAAIRAEASAVRLWTSGQFQPASAVGDVLGLYAWGINFD